MVGRCTSAPPDLDGFGAVALAERGAVDLLELELAREHVLLPLLVGRDVGVELRHHLAREELEARADVLVRVAAGLVQEDHLVDVRGLELAQLAPDRLGRADQAAGQRALQRLGVGRLPLLVFVPHVDRAGRRPLAVAALRIEAQAELEEGDAVGLARASSSVGAHMNIETSAMFGLVG